MQPPSNWGARGRPSLHGLSLHVSRPGPAPQWSHRSIWGLRASTPRAAGAHIPTHPKTWPRLLRPPKTPIGGAQRRRVRGQRRCGNAPPEPATPDSLRRRFSPSTDATACQPPLPPTLAAAEPPASALRTLSLAKDEFLQAVGLARNSISLHARSASGGRGLSSVAPLYAAAGSEEEGPPRGSFGSPTAAAGPHLSVPLGACPASPRAAPRQAVLWLLQGRDAAGEEETPTPAAAPLLAAAPTRRAPSSGCPSSAAAAPPTCGGPCWCCCWT